MIYPKEYIVEKCEITPDTAFLIMPFDDQFEHTHAIINNVCKHVGIKSNRADDIFKPNPIMNNILDGIMHSEIVIVDISEKNPNVYYELGIAHTCRDKESIILITQDIKNIPFDIRHISILEYSLDNIPEFKHILKEKITTCRNVAIRESFIKQYLRANNISHNEIVKFIDISKRISEQKLDLLYKILSGKTDSLQNEVIDVSGLVEYFTLLHEYSSGIIENATETIKANLFCSDYMHDNYRDFTKSMLIKSRRNLVGNDNSEQYNFVAKLCFKLIEKNKLKEDSINWIHEYLYNYRMGRIDIVRSQIERFLVETEDQDVNNALIKMLQSECITVRESAADICGQKLLYISLEPLISLLQTESNPHVARSCITALTRLDANNASQVIYDWMIQNKDKWGKQAVSASLHNIALASLKKLDEGDYLYESLKTMY